MTAQFDFTLAIAEARLQNETSSVTPELRGKYPELTFLFSAFEQQALDAEQREDEAAERISDLLEQREELESDIAHLTEQNESLRSLIYSIQTTLEEGLED